MTTSSIILTRVLPSSAPIIKCAIMGKGQTGTDIIKMLMEARTSPSLQEATPAFLLDGKEEPVERVTLTALPVPIMELRQLMYHRQATRAPATAAVGKCQSHTSHLLNSQTANLSLA